MDVVVHVVEHLAVPFGFLNLVATVLVFLVAREVFEQVGLRFPVVDLVEVACLVIVLVLLHLLVVEANKKAPRFPKGPGRLEACV